MLPILGVYEVAIRVRDLEKAEAFYREVLGLAFGTRVDARRMTFLRAGGAAGVVALQEDAGEWPPQHFAFAIGAADLDRAVAHLREHGVRVSGAVDHEWMQARSVYFADPDGHQLELCAPLTAR
jgi:catechol-2,3-dioxygenase